MRYEIIDRNLREIDADENYVSRKFDAVIHQSFRRVMGLVRAARDMRDLYAFKALRLEKLVGDRAGQHSMRLNKQFRLIVQFKSDSQGQSVLIIEVVDYH